MTLKKHKIRKLSPLSHIKSNLKIQNINKKQVNYIKNINDHTAMTIK